jgi:hypothetical protein
MLRSLNRYWIQNPPEHILLKAFVGYKPPARQMGGQSQSSRLPPSQASQAEPVEALFAAVTAMGGSIRT